MILAEFSFKGALSESSAISNLSFFQLEQKNSVMTPFIANPAETTIMSSTETLPFCFQLTLHRIGSESDDETEVNIALDGL